MPQLAVLCILACLGAAPAGQTASLDPKTVPSGVAPAPGSLDFAASLNELGIAAARRGELAQAEELFLQALALQRQLAPTGREEAMTRIYLGNIAHQRGDLVAAEESFRRAIGLLERVNPDDAELARALSRLGVLERDRGDLDLAEAHIRQGLAIRQKIKPESLDVSGSLQNLGFIAQARGDWEAAEEYFRLALAIRQKLAPGSGFVAESLGNLGMILWHQGDLAKADEFLRGSLAIHEQRDPASRNTTSAWIQRGKIAVGREDLALAEELFTRALAGLDKSSPGGLETADAAEGLGVVSLQRGDLRRAEELFRRALAISEAREPDGEGLGILLNELGRVHRQAGRLAMATESLCRAIDVLDRQRRNLGGTMEQRATFGRKTAELYRDCLAAHVDEGRLDEAFQTLERGRARSFLDLLAERGLDRTDDLPPDLARERRQVDGEYDHVQAALAGLGQNVAGDEANRLRVRLQELRFQQKEVAAKVRRAAPRAALADPQPVDLTAARQTLDPGTVLAAWSVGRDRSFLLVVQPQGAAGSGLEIYPIPVGELALRQRIGAFRDLLQRADPDPALADQARALYDLLLRPADARIAGASRLLLSPDGPLHALPFAALIRNGRFLAEHLPTHTVLSATVYAELRKNRRAGSAAFPVELAAFGDPSYPPSATDPALAPEIRAATGRGLDLTPVPATRTEVSGIASLFPGARLFLGTEATEETATSIGKGVRYLHFACHGLLDARSPLRSALALAIPSRPDEGRDNGLLQAWEIIDRVRLDADLVTLSACNSAMGPEMGGEGLLGLTRAFQVAGARSVLASLWSVADVSTTDLMQRFYRHLRSGLAKDEALRAAQIELIHSSRFSHPFHWAAFELTGDWR
ncbi:MAG TPA: hypothetical protein DD490_14910 [Acidobacteria bacterium]|nr:hypothetical protein [Acidobacteriota bacterium]